MTMLICLLFAYLYGTGKIEVTQLQIEGIEVPQIDAKTQTIIFSIVAVINLILALLTTKLVKCKMIMIVLSAIQALLGSILNMIAAGICIPILCIKTKDIQEEKQKLVIPTLEEIKPKSKWIYTIIWITIFIIAYTPLVSILSNQINPIILAFGIIGIYILQIVGTILPMIREIKRDFKAFFKNFKAYMAYILPRFGVFVLAYFIVAMILLITVGEIATNQQELNQMPIAVTAVLAIVIAPVIEELMFRGLLKKMLGNGKLFLMVSSIVFGLLHVMYVEENLLSYLYIIPYTMLGFLLAKVYSKTDNIFTNIFIHGIWNTIAVIMMIITQIGG